MATLITPEKFDQLIVEARPLYEKAHLMSLAIPTRAELTPNDQEAERHVNSACMAIQAVMAGSPFSDTGLAMILGAVFGTMLAQCDTQEKLVMSFWSQTNLTMSEVAENLRPKGEC